MEKRKERKNNKRIKNQLGEIKNMKNKNFMNLLRNLIVEHKMNRFTKLVKNMQNIINLNINKL